MGATSSIDGVVGDGPRLFSAARVDEMRVEQRPIGGGDGGSDVVSEGGSGALLDNAGAAFGLGVQVHEFILEDGSTCRSIGHRAGWQRGSHPAGGWHLVRVHDEYAEYG